MFAALEVAEIHEALEQSRAANGEVTGPSPSKDVKGRASGHKPQAKVEAKGHRKKKGNPNSKSGLVVPRVGWLEFWLVGV